jgi:hypothetical protein
MSGFIALRREMVPALSRVHRGFKILLLLLATHPRARVVEVPYQFQERTSGASKVVADLGFLRTFALELLYDRRLMARASSRRRPGPVDGSETSSGPGQLAR